MVNRNVVSAFEDHRLRTAYLLPSMSERGKQHQTSIGSIGVGGDGRASAITRSPSHPAISRFLAKRILSREKGSFVTSDAAL